MATAFGRTVCVAPGAEPSGMADPQTMLDALSEAAVRASAREHEAMATDDGGQEAGDAAFIEHMLEQVKGASF